MSDSPPITITARLREGITEDKKFYEKLDAIASKWGRLERRLYVEQFAKGKLSDEEKNKLKRDWLIQNSLSSMQFNAIDRQLCGKISALKECVKISIDSIKTKISRVKADLVDKKLEGKQGVKHQKKRKLYNLEQKLKRLQERSEISICFGSRTLFKSQFYSKKDNYEEWLKEWRNTRNNQFLCLGIAAYPSGNSACVLTITKEDSTGVEGELKIKSFAGLPELTIPVKFTHNTAHLLSALKNKTAITYRFYRKGSKWYVHASLERAPVSLVTSPINGYLGVDMNKEHISCARINNDGNLVSLFDLSFRFKEGKYESGNRRKHLILIAAKHVVAKARDAGVPIVIEKLDFTKKKRELKSRGYNKMLSSFAYSTFNKAIHSAAQKVGVEVIEVNPVSTSIIGYWKFARGMGLTRHQGAAYAIARRAATTFTKHVRVSKTEVIINPKTKAREPKKETFFVPHAKFSERLKVFPSKNPPVLPERNRMGHVWSEWGKVKLPSKPAGKQKDGRLSHSKRMSRSGKGAKAPITAQEEERDEQVLLDCLVPTLHLETGSNVCNGNGAIANIMPASGKEEVICERPKLGALSAQPVEVQ